MAKTVWQKGIPLNESAQARLRALIKEKGEKETAKIFEIGVVSVVRAAAGLGLRRGTSRMIELGLAAMQKSTERAA